MTNNDGPRRFENDEYEFDLSWYILRYRKPVVLKLNQRNIKKLDRQLRIRFRRVRLYRKNDKLSVSTVFLGMAHGKDTLGRSLLFETMIIDENQENIYHLAGRCATWREALFMHKYTVSVVKKYRE